MTTSLTPAALVEAGAHATARDYTDPALIALIRKTTGVA